MKYILENHFQRPKYNYMVRCVSSADLVKEYWLYKNPIEAHVKACALSIAHHQTFDVIEPFRNSLGEYKTKTVARYNDGHCEEVSISDTYGLHFIFFSNSGEWQNQEEG